jgi:hypothetical protein
MVMLFLLDETQVLHHWILMDCFKNSVLVEMHRLNIVLIVIAVI